MNACARVWARAKGRYSSRQPISKSYSPSSVILSPLFASQNYRLSVESSYWKHRSRKVVLRVNKVFGFRVSRKRFLVCFDSYLLFVILSGCVGFVSVKELSSLNRGLNLLIAVLWMVEGV